MSKTPEQWLEQAEQPKKLGLFKVFLGYAPGVGKTYSMLSEGIRRHSRGEDVVIGVVETHGRAGTAELAERLETVPRKKLEYKGTIFEEMDVDAILARKPQVALVDELAHTNIDGSKHRKRYEDILELLDANIDVISTINVQHIESVSPIVARITGVVVRETVPDWVLQRVDEIVLTDLTPEALKNRMMRGDIYPLDRAERALANFFRPGNLIALREIALRQVSHVVDRGLEKYLEKEHIEHITPIAETFAVLHQLQSGGAVPHGTRAADIGIPASMPNCMSSTSISVPTIPPEYRRSLQENSSFCRKPGRNCDYAEGQKRSGRGGEAGSRKAHHAGCVRALRRQRMEEVSVLVGDPQIFARRACEGRCTHRDPGGRAEWRKTSRTSQHYSWLTTSRRLPACCAPRSRAMDMWCGQPAMATKRLRSCEAGRLTW